MKACQLPSVLKVLEEKNSFIPSLLNKSLKLGYAINPKQADGGGGGEDSAPSWFS